ncbi:MAG TPA: FMN-binding protein [Candidatus Eisenbacteria bacterium]|nr:FMN-binding protein [Candidatus Eisenbacteria bacterium]
MRRIAVAVVFTVSVLLLLFSYHTSTMGAGASALAGLRPGTRPQPSPATGGTTTGGSGSSGSAAGDRTVDGDVADTRWGPVQVQLHISGGKITDVAMLAYPQGNFRDVEINSYALPVLIQETVDKQSANIDTVGGATVTSDGYLQSLQSALDKAHL